MKTGYATWMIVLPLILSSVFAFIALFIAISAPGDGRFAAIGLLVLSLTQLVTAAGGLLRRIKSLEAEMETLRALSAPIKLSSSPE
jgi:hypothetical protein